MNHDSTPIPHSNGMSLDDVRSQLNGLHFAKEQLSPGEHNILFLAESLLRYIDEKLGTRLRRLQYCMLCDLLTEEGSRWPAQHQDHLHLRRTVVYEVGSTRLTEQEILDSLHRFRANRIIHNLRRLAGLT